MIREIKWHNHKILGNLELNFTKPDGTPYNTIVLAGENGVGKTTILETVATFLNLETMEPFEYIKYIVDGIPYTISPEGDLGKYGFHSRKNETSDEMQTIHSGRDNNRARIEEDTADLRHYGFSYSKARSGFNTGKIKSTTTQQLDSQKYENDSKEDFTLIKQLLLIVFLLLLILLFKYLQTKRQIRNLSKQIAELVNGKSEKMLDISLIDKDLEQLAGILNQYNDNQRQLIASTLRHENYLKESIANISHDLRTPLTVILGHLQLLRKETLTDKQEQRIETIFHKAERMKELVQTFYDLSILDAEQITPRREDFNLSNLLINLITENAPALEAKNISPEIDLPPHSVYLNSDYSMVERILQNLLTNAIRYSSGDIKMGLKQTRKNRAIFTIENPIDSKTEINPARLFERFYTGDASRHNSGTGVGLAVVKLLTDKLGGNVSAEIKSNVLTVTLEIQ